MRRLRWGRKPRLSTLHTPLARFPSLTSHCTPSPTSCSNTESSGWLKAALAHFRVLLLDQRGTGGSAPVTSGTLSRLPGPAHAKAEYLSHLRADNIVRDCEAVRRALGADRVSILGQSFGGFCCLTYLSFYPGSLREALITGGLAPKIGSPAAAEEAYKHTFRR